MLSSHKSVHFTYKISLYGNHRQDLLLFPKVQGVGVWSHPALLRSANVSDKEKWDWTVTQQSSAAPQLKEEYETLKSKHLCLQKI